MKRMRLFIICLAILLLALPAHAAMSSANYRITTTVMSGGGGTMGSSSYALTGTLGQPSPLIDPLDPPFSTSYEMLTGFWYTIGGAGISNCPADLNADGSVDEDDLEMLADRFGQTLVSVDTDGDWDMDGSDLYEMVFDWNRTDCLGP